MDRELEVLQWQNLFSIESTNNYSNRWFPDKGEAVCMGVQISRQWSEKERTFHINVLELLVIKLDLFSFTKGKRVKTIHFQIEYMIKLSKEIWHYLLNHNTSITAGSLPLVLNAVAYRESRKKTDCSEWLLHPHVFE